ncbi:MAG: DHH family phosphoesterase [Planctomycetota bacterium]|jgi:phosphoesterase RecJ-like protein
MGKDQTAELPAGLIEQIESMKRPIVVGHVVPDADCLGSMLAVAQTWPAGDEGGARVCLPEGSLSRRLAFLMDWAPNHVVGPEALQDADGFIVVDTARKPRCNVGPQTPDTWSDGRVVVNIDHHETNTLFGDINWVVATASSSAELIYGAIRAAERPVTPLIASLLYAGMHTDTRGFTLPGTGGAALAVAAELVSAGAQVAELGERLYRSQPRGEFELLRIIYANTRVTADGRIAYSTADYGEITGSGCNAADIDEQVGVPRSLGGIDLALLFTEGDRGKTRINLRGESGVAVVALAKELGGGGHEQAAGAVLDCGISEALDRVLPLAEEHLNRQRGAGRPASSLKRGDM